MAPPGSSQTLLSPAELAFIHSSLLQQPPIRPDLRKPTEFRPLVAETDVLPSTNGSARICFSDGTECIVGVKAEVEKTKRTWGRPGVESLQDVAMLDAAEDGEREDEVRGKLSKHRVHHQGQASETWLEVAIEIPGFREDDNLPVFLSAMLSETLRASTTLKDRLLINDRWNWKLYIDVLLLSPPLSYPLPLLSLTTHLALIHTALPRLTSEPSDDPLFDDDWAAAVPLYTRSSPATLLSANEERPPITLLVMTVGDNIIFDPSKEELAVAESVLAISIISSPAEVFDPAAEGIEEGVGAQLRLLAIRTVDPPSRLTPPGIPNTINPATNPGAAASVGPGNPGLGGGVLSGQQETLAEQERDKVWSPPRGGMNRALLASIIKMIIKKDGVGMELLAALAAVQS